ncbi:Na+/H+ antiporter subunit E [Bartonella sp. DGB1]|uniref:Na+/H+ antiporter subunit E n=1 Tax=Bartonella sp. DGB1 TaxID=3239807 RepID=UPI003523F37E
MKQQKVKLISSPILTIFLLSSWLIIHKFGWNSFFIGLIFLFILIIIYSTCSTKLPLKKIFLLIKFIFCLIKSFIIGSIKFLFILITFKFNPKKQGIVKIPLKIDNNKMLLCLSLILSSSPGTLWIKYNKTKKLLYVHRLNLTEKDKTNPRHLIEQHEKLVKELFQ